MRRAATILFASAVGIHCSATPSAIDDEPAETELVDVPPEIESAEEAPHAALGLTGVWEGNFGGPDFASTVILEDGVTFVAGTFADTIKLGDAVLHSRGQNDVFIARFDADGSFAWARSIGSHLNENGPSLRFENARLILIATTRGQVNCGRGSFGSWNSEMFFMCSFDPDGTSHGGAAFPTGSP